jgi:DNA repair exonuclease SbcCD nuclease subunit
LGQHPDLIVIAGDVFHSVRPTNPAILFLFQQLQRIRATLPNSPIVVVAGEHDTPRSLETGAILRLYEALGVEIAIETPRRIVFPKLDCAVLAVPHQALAQADRPALRPERGGPTFNILVTHGNPPGLGDERGTMEYGGASLSREVLAPEKWDYVALGHYHVAHAVETNAWYAGSLEYVSPNPWGQLQDEADHKRTGKGWLLVDLPGARVSFRPVAPVRRHLDLPPINGGGLTPKDLDALIAERVANAKPPIDDQVVRLTVWEVARTTARELDHTAIRSYKARALNFQLDLRRPEEARTESAGLTARRQTLPEMVREFLSHRPLDADLPRDDFVRLGVEYVEHAGGAGTEGEGGEPG